MGGRGASSGNTNTIMKKGETKIIYLSRKMESTRAVLIATEKNGVVNFRAADDSIDKVEGRPAGTVAVKHGMINGRLINIDLEKAREVTGNTYENQGTIRAKGFKWSKTKRVWYNDRLPDSEKKQYL